jgi:hypothetical protein
MLAKEIAAFLIGCKPDEFMKFRDEGEDGVVVIGPDGKKYRFDSAQLEKGEIAMQQDQTLAEAAAEASASEAHAPKSRPKPRRTPPKRKTAPKKKTTSTPSKSSGTKA